MQKFILAVGFAVLSLVSYSVEAASFEEGVHYHELSTDKADAPVITEFFSFYCQSCYHYQPFNEKIKTEWPDILVKHHVSNNATIQQAWAVARLLKVDSGFADAVFSRNFVERNQVNSMDAVYEIFNDLGIEQAEIDRVMAGFQVRGLVRRMQIEEERYNVRGTPTYIVNGRYRMDYRAFRNSEDFFNDYLELARYLLEK